MGRKVRKKGLVPEKPKVDWAGAILTSLGEDSLSESKFLGLVFILDSFHACHGRGW
jgi:hypothetical protein